MKIRNDFVSNSSSSSFVLFGSEITKNELIDLYKRQKGHENDDEDDLDMGDIYDDLIWEKFDTTLFDFDSKSSYAGTSPDKMQDNETLKEFKQKIVDKFEALGLHRTINDIEFISGIEADGSLGFN